MSISCAVHRMPKDNFPDELRDFIVQNGVVCDVDRVVDYLYKGIGACSFDDMQHLSLEDLTEEDTGLKLIQRKKLFSLLKNYKSSKDVTEAVSSRKPSEPKNEPFVPPVYDRFGEGAVVDSISNPSITISLRYIFCRNLFMEETKEHIIVKQFLNRNTIRDVMDTICSRERIDDDHIIELFTHEGYPINVNMFNEDCHLAKWGFQNSSLLYVFERKKKQNVIVTAMSECEKLDKNRGTHTIVIHSVLYGTFSVVADLAEDTGKSIKQKVYSLKGLHPDFFSLHTRPSNHDFISECIDTWNNGNIQELLQTSSESDDGQNVVDIMMKTSPLFSCRSGVTHCFGKCTYSPLVEQTDKGYSKLYSILYHMIYGLKGTQKSQLLTFLQKEYNLPPMTYALMVLFKENSLEQFPQWVALIEGFYQLSVSILKEGFTVPNNRVFECSDSVWGMLCKQSEKIDSSKCIQKTPVSLLCKLSDIRMVEPVTLPRCADVFEKEVIQQRIKSGTAIPNCDVKDLTVEKLKKANNVDRLLMLCGFHHCETFLTWEVKSSISSIFPLELPTDVTWEYILQSRNKFKPSSTFLANNLSFYKEHLVVITRVLKDQDVGREIYYPNYDPEDNSGTIKISKSECKVTSSEEIDLKAFVKPSIRTTLSSGEFNHQNGDTEKEDLNAPKITEDPSEAVVVVLDCSKSMSEPIFNDPTKHGQHLDRLTAAKQLLGSFLNRTEGFSYHHVVGLISCSSAATVEVVLTDDYNMFERKIEPLHTRGGTALYDSIIKGCELLVKLKDDYPVCKRRIICLTDGEDLHSRKSIQECFKALRDGDVLLDSILIIGPKGNINQKALSHATGGFCFHPRTMVDALKIFETETILSSRVRQIRQEPLSDSLTSYQNIAKYPYNATEFYGQQDLRTQFAHDLSKSNFSNPARIVHHTVLFGQKQDSSRTQRIMQEIQSYLRAPHPDIDIYPQEDNISRWKIVLIGPEGTPYEGGTFILYAKFPENYPDRPPEIRFETPIYHCNINSNGRICHSSLDTRYVPRTKIRSLLDNVYGLLMSPEPLDPLDSVLALELSTNRKQYEDRARELVQKFAKGIDRRGIRKEIVSEEGDAPPSICCPLTTKLFVDPVTTEYGHTYERKALMDHMASNNNMDPLVRKPISSDRIFPNLNVKELVAAYRKTKQ